MLTQEEIRELFVYDPETGYLHWRKSPSRNVKDGQRITHQSPMGYIKVARRKRNYFVHRLIWVLVHGEIPEGLQIDHINGCKSDNRITNLRLATQAENMSNIPVSPRNTTGFKGVSLHKKTGKYYAGIAKDGRSYNLGLHDTPALAAAAYDIAAKKLHGSYARTNKMRGLLP